MVTEFKFPINPGYVPRLELDTVVGLAAVHALGFNALCRVIPLTNAAFFREIFGGNDLSFLFG